MVLAVVLNDNNNIRVTSRRVINVTKTDSRADDCALAVTTILVKRVSLRGRVQVKGFTTTGYDARHQPARPSSCRRCSTPVDIRRAGTPTVTFVNFCWYYFNRAILFVHAFKSRSLHRSSRSQGR